MHDDDAAIGRLFREWLEHGYAEVPGIQWISVVDQLLPYLEQREAAARTAGDFEMMRAITAVRRQVDG